MIFRYLALLPEPPLVRACRVPKGALPLAPNEALFGNMCRIAGVRRRDGSVGRVQITGVTNRLARTRRVIA